MAKALRMTSGRWLRMAPDDGVILQSIKDKAESRLALTLCPGVHAVAERTRAAARSRDRPHRGIDATLQKTRKNLETGAAKDVGDILHDNRIPQVRLIGAV